MAKTSSSLSRSRRRKQKSPPRIFIRRDVRVIAREHKPDSVSLGCDSRRALAVTAIHLHVPLPTRFCTRPVLIPQTRGTHQSGSRTACACTRWGLPSPHCHQYGGALLPHHFTLTCVTFVTIGGIFLWHFP